MKFHCHAGTDSLYIDLSEKPAVDSREVSPGVVLDFGEDGQLVGIDIDQASKNLDLRRLEAVALPLASVSLAMLDHVREMPYNLIQGRVGK
jgi:uncharacterized protein YuzE